jgi:6-phosphogluconolactonase
MAIPLAVHGTQLHAFDQNTRLLFVGTQTDSSTSRGIYSFAFDDRRGELHPLGLAAETPNPRFIALSPDRKFLFAANELETFAGRNSGSLTSFSLERRTGKLQAVNTVSTQGTGPCNVAVDSEGRCVFTANFTGGSVSSFRVMKDGRLSEAVSHFQFEGHGPNPQRQTGPHAHRVTVSPDRRFLLVNDLGLDCIHIYRLNSITAQLAPHDPPRWVGEPGSGPRALRFHPNGRWCYCVCEMASTVTTLEWNVSTGRLTTLQTTRLVTTPTLPGGSDIVLASDVRFAYVANRGDGFVATLSIDRRRGTLSLLERIPTGGKIPRHLALCPSGRWLLVANQDSDSIAVIRRDQVTGELAKERQLNPISRPQCVVFV